MGHQKAQKHIMKNQELKIQNKSFVLFVPFGREFFCGS